MATYYIRADGTSTKSGATDPTSSSTSMSPTTFNAATFEAGDVVVFSGRGGTITTQVIIPSSGSDDSNRIVYRGESDHIPTLNHDVLSLSCSKSYVDIDDLNITGGTSGAEFSGTGVGIRTHDLTFFGSVNQSLQHLNTAHVDHYNLTTSGAVDEGLSMHDSPTVRVFGGSISGHNGINWVGTGSIELYDCSIQAENSAGYAIQPSATSYNFKAHRCLIIETTGSTKRAIDFNAAGNVEFVNCVFRNLGTTDYYLLLRSSLTTARLMNCVFYSGSITGAVVFNQLSTGIYKNNIFHTTTSGSGKGFYSSSGVDKTCYYLSGSTYYGTTYTTSDPMLVNPTSGDYHLQSGSPCRSIGADLSAYFTVDIDGETRTVPWDIGADQYIEGGRLQTCYRFRNDDGSETSATWMESENTVITKPADSDIRLRLSLESQGNPAPKNLQLEYRRVGDVDWKKVTL